jgi:hypothetical protein
MAKNKTPEKKQEAQTPAPADPRIRRTRAALEFLANGADEICDGGNQPMPGFVAYGFANVMQWAAEQLEAIEKGPEGGAQ